MTAIPALGHPSLTAAIRALAGEGLDHDAIAARLDKPATVVRSLEKQGRRANPGRRGSRFEPDPTRITEGLRGPFREIIITIARPPGLRCRTLIHIPRQTTCHACGQPRPEIFS